jgi:pilus assembly protein Flp/PilA
MAVLYNQLQRFAADESGATAIEYALIGVLIAVAIIGSMTLAGDGVADLFNGVRDKSLDALAGADL